jgi:aryl-alcohol dehydrogenase-like predicted oxidoreductase
MTMRYRLLGRTGMYVSELCLGTMTFGGIGYFEKMGTLRQAAVTEQVRLAFEAGVNFIDSANVYSYGEAERLLGQALKDLSIARDRVVIATKGGLIMEENTPNGRGQSRYHLMHALSASLERLQVDHIDLYQLHSFDQLTPIEETLSVLADMVRSGMVRYIGLSNVAAWQLMKALAISERRNWPRFECIQVYYTIAGRDVERELVPLVRDQQVGLTVWSPLAGGLLSGKFSAQEQGPAGARRAQFDFPIVDKARAFQCVDAMRTIATRSGATVSQIALAWLLSRPWVSSVIVGAKTTDQLRENLAAADVELNAEDLAVLDEVSRLPPEYPGWMFEFQGRYRATPSVHEQALPDDNPPRK